MVLLNHFDRNKLTNNMYVEWIQASHERQGPPHRLFLSNHFIYIRIIRCDLNVFISIGRCVKQHFKRKLKY